MPLLVAAASDQTGRTITMLSAGLVAVAFGLTVLTIWYWRFTSPRRQAAVSVADGKVEAEEPETTMEPEVGHNLHQARQAESEAPDSSPDDGSSIGLDDDQWAVLTEAVMDRYLDP